MELNTLIAALHKERKRQGLSRSEVASTLRIDPSTLRDLEHPKSNPTVKSIRRYAQALGVQVSVEVEVMRVITFFNHAGGVGKSSTARDVAYLLGERGFKVLLIDADPQANLTEWVGITEDVPLEKTIYQALIDEGSVERLDDLLLPPPEHVHGIDFIPSTLELAAAEQRLMGEVDGVRRLREAVSKLEGYDFVLIDPSPSLGMLSSCCTVAADYVVVPLPPNSKGRKGLPTILTTIKRFRRANPKLRLLMAVVTNRENTRQDREMLELYQEKLGQVMPLSSPLTHRPAVFRNAEHAGQPIPVFEPGGEADREIRVVMDELMAALDSNAGGTP